MYPRIRILYKTMKLKDLRSVHLADTVFSQYPHVSGI